MEQDEEDQRQTSTRPQQVAAAATTTRMNQIEAQRARSLGRSRSRGRATGNPSELLARKQQLLSSSSQLDSWHCTEDSGQDEEFGSANHRRSQRRRADSIMQQQQQQHQHSAPVKMSPTTDNGLIDARLENLTSELLKSQQQQQAAYSDGQSPTKSIEDVYILLAKKEKDLQLAAELGKVLLERNDELSKANERITEDYSHKLELLEQDKHKLKRKLDLLGGEYENRVIELQTDCNILKNQLDEQQQVTRQIEKEKSKLIDDLVQQNQRLTSELVEATKSEELLSSQLEQMNERFNVRMSNRQDHAVQLEALKEEIHIVNQRKQDLERRLKLAHSDKSELNSALDESGDKILLLENLLNEKDSKLGELIEELNELRDSSSWLSNELESMISLNEKLAGAEDEFGEQLANELSSPTGNSQLRLAARESQAKRSQLIEQLKELRLRNRSRIKASEMILISRRARAKEAGATRLKSDKAAPKRRRNARGPKQRGDDLESSSGNNRSSPDSNGLSHESQDYDDEDEYDCDEVDDADNYASGRVKRDDSQHDWSNEVVVEVYTILRRFQSNLQARKESFHSTGGGVGVGGQTVASGPSPASSQLLSIPNSTDDSGISGYGEGATEQARDPAQWRQLLSSLKSLIEEMPCSTCQLMIAERADYEQLRKLHAKLGDEMRRKNDELLNLSMAKTEQDTKLRALEERCAILSQDLDNCDKPKEEIVKLAWKARDEAVERKNSAEISLAKTRIENMQIASQLMEVVQQKGELSQKLAQFEDDIHYITQDSVKAKFTWEEHAEKLRRSRAQPDSMSSNPLAQLISSFSAASAATVATTITNKTSAQTVTSNDDTKSGYSNQDGSKSSATDSQPASLMRNFTSNRFNLRFWQKSSTEKATAMPTTPVAGETYKSVSGNGSNNNNNNKINTNNTKAITTTPTN